MSVKPNTTFHYLFEAPEALLRLFIARADAYGDSYGIYASNERVDLSNPFPGIVPSFEDVVAEQEAAGLGASDLWNGDDTWPTDLNLDRIGDGFIQLETEPSDYFRPVYRMKEDALLIGAMYLLAIRQTVLNSCGQSLQGRPPKVS